MTFPPGRLKLGTRPACTRIGADAEHDRNARGGSLGGERSRRAEWGGDNGHPAPHQIGRQFRQAFQLAFCPAKFKGDVLTFDVAGLAQAFAEPRDQRRKLLGRTMMEKSNDRHCRLLRVRRERPRGCRAAEQNDKLATPHSITSSARASTGTSRPVDIKSASAP